jgi:hypothetical protein
MITATLSAAEPAARKLTPRDLVRAPFTIPGFEPPAYDPATQSSVPADPIRMLFTHCSTTATYDTNGKPVDAGPTQADD